MKNKKSSTLKIGILSNFTINGLSEDLEKKCQDLSLDITIYNGKYNQINQEFLDKKSGLKKFKPNITFLIINNEFVFEENEIKIIRSKNERISYVNDKVNQFINIINLFLKNISGILIVSNLKQSSYTTLGINEDKIEFSNQDWIGFFNDKIKSEFIKDNRVRIYDFNGFFLKFGENHIINDKLRYLGDVYISPYYFSQLAEELMSYIKPLAAKNRKCIVLDLDNVLWGGIIGEDGFDNINLDNKPPGNAYQEFQKYLLALHKRGILLAINSKNNLDETLKVIREHPQMILREKHFACIKINWQNKVYNMKEIASEINIGTDSLVFIDDDPFNRALIKNNLSEILVVDLPNDASLYVKSLKNLNDFNTWQLTEEDFNRNEIYAQQKQRIELQNKITNLEDFLKSLEMQIKIAKVTDFTISRVAQLTQKTNQFNLTTKRYTEEDIKSFTKSQNYEVFSVNAKDKFGDHGLIGVIIIQKEKNQLLIDTFLLSCRVIGRNIEKCMLKYIIDFAKKENIKKVIGQYFSTQKNAQVKNFYIENGFNQKSKENFELNDFDKITTIDHFETLV